jgi:adenylosuccinate synthase
MDLQFGSTGKGLIAGYLANRWMPDVGVCSFGPNAGHTFIDNSGKYVHMMLPMAVFSPKIKNILIGPGAILDVERLQHEINALYRTNPYRKFNVWIHPNTPILSQRHRDAEQELVTIGSTMKGTAECVIEKMRRLTPRIVAKQHCGHGFWFNCYNTDVFVSSVPEFSALIMEADCLQIEGAQGHSLSIHGEFYPHCTSRDVSFHQIMADCGVPATVNPTCIGTVRTYPIRVANRFDAEGDMIGYSGDCYLDQHEVSWEDIGVAPEKTTVTNLERRVFTFSETQVAGAIGYNDVHAVFLNFCNYTEQKALDYIIQRIEQYSEVRWLGYGPSIDDVRELEL